MTKGGPIACNQPANKSVYNDAQLSGLRKEQS